MGRRATQTTYVDGAYPLTPQLCIHITSLSSAYRTAPCREACQRRKQSSTEPCPPSPLRAWKRRKAAATSPIQSALRQLPNLPNTIGSCQHTIQTICLHRDGGGDLLVVKHTRRTTSRSVQWSELALQKIHRWAIVLRWQGGCDLKYNTTHEMYFYTKDNAF